MNNQTFSFTKEGYKAMIASRKNKKTLPINAYAKIGDDTKSLVIRIPADAREAFKIQKGQYIRFHSKIIDGKLGPLEITIEHAKPAKS